MLATLNRDSPLFESVVPFQISDVGAHDVRHANLMLRVLEGTQPTSTAGLTEDVICLEVTDEKDSYFLFYFIVGEHNFHLLKENQQMVVDFKDFSKHMIKLINECQKGSSTTLAFEDSVGSFKEKGENFYHYLRLDLVHSLIQVIRVDSFKKVCQIELSITRGDDAAIKSYLASRLHLTLDYYHDVSSRFTILEQRHNELSDLYTAVNDEIANLRSHQEIELHTLQNTHDKELNELQTKSIHEQEQLRAKYEHMIDELKQTIEIMNKEMKQTALQHEKKVKELEHERSRLELAMKHEQMMMKTLQEDRDRFEREVHKLSDIHKEDEQIKTDLNNIIIGLKSKVSNMEEKVKFGAERIEQNNELRQASENAKTEMMDKNQLLVTQLTEQKERIERLETELHLRREKHQKLKTDCKALQEKILEKNETLRRQESKVKEHETITTQLQQEITIKRQTEHEHITKIQDQEKRIQDLIKELTETKDILERKQLTLQYVQSVHDKPYMARQELNHHIGGSTPFNNNNTSTSMYQEFEEVAEASYDVRADNANNTNTSGGGGNKSKHVSTPTYSGTRSSHHIITPGSFTGGNNNNTRFSSTMTSNNATNMIQANKSFQMTNDFERNILSIQETTLPASTSATNMLKYNTIFPVTEGYYNVTTTEINTIDQIQAKYSSKSNNNNNNVASNMTGEVLDNYNYGMKQLYGDNKEQQDEIFQLLNDNYDSSNTGSGNNSNTISNLSNSEVYDTKYRTSANTNTNNNNNKLSSKFSSTDEYFRAKNNNNTTSNNNNASSPPHKTSRTSYYSNTNDGDTNNNNNNNNNANVNDNNNIEFRKSRVQHIHNNLSSGKNTYSWQEPDFGVEDDD